MSDFWSSTKTEPKRKFRWVLSISPDDTTSHGDITIPAWIIKKVTKPTFSVSEVKHSYINHSFYYPGRMEYNEVEFTLVDPVDPDAASSVMKILDISGYKLPDSEVHAAQTITKESAVAALGGLTIEMISGQSIDSEGVTVIESWYLKNAWIKEVSFGDLDYESDDIAEITVKVRYDWAELGGDNGGDGAGAGAGWRSPGRSRFPGETS